MYKEILETLQKVITDLDQIPVNGLNTIKMANSLIALNELGQKVQTKINEENVEEKSTDK